MVITSETYNHMTKKHYIAISEIVKGTAQHDTKYTEQTIKAFKILTYQLADYFATDNPKFNRKMFLTACGIETRPTCKDHPETQLHKRDNEWYCSECNPF